MVSQREVGRPEFQLTILAFDVPLLLTCERINDSL